MACEETRKALLRQYQDSHDLEDEHNYRWYEDERQSIWKKNKCTRSCVHWTALAISVILNIFLAFSQNTLKSQDTLCISEYTGLGFATDVAYWQYTDYVHENRTIADELWDAIDTSPNTIALDREYAKTHSLELSIPFPWDPAKGLYLIKAFHHMHCLKNIRKAYIDALESQPGKQQLIPQEHVLHCLDILRQDIKCRPDDTPMPSIQQRHKFGDGQVRKCKDWDALVRWTQDPKRHACFRMLSDYRRVPHSLEQFAFCLEDSPYTKVMEAYFEEHGHRDPYTIGGEREEAQGINDEY